MDMGTSLASDFVVDDETPYAKLALIFLEINIYDSLEKI